MKPQITAALLLSLAGTVHATGSVISFSPDLNEPPIPTKYEEGMAAWLDLPGSQLVDIPDWMLEGEHKAWVLKELIKADTTITMSCPAGSTCDFYVYVYHCPPCALHGGLPAALLSSGWVSGSCAPKFVLKAGGQRHEMSIFRKQVAGGESVTFATTLDARFVGFGATPQGVWCSSATNYFECSACLHCKFEGGVCKDYWCPRRFGHGRPPPMCTICADSELPPVASGPVPGPPGQTANGPDVHTYVVGVDKCGDDEQVTKSKRQPWLPQMRLRSRSVSIGVRWKVDIPKHATVLSAHVEFLSDQGGNSDRMCMSYGLEDTSDAKPFWRWSLADRELVDAMTWMETKEWTQGNWYSTPDLKDQLQKLVGGTQWEAGNALVFLARPLQARGCTGVRVATTCDAGTGKSPKLAVKYTTTRSPGASSPAPPPPTPPPPSPGASTPCPGGRVRVPYSALSCSERTTFVSALQDFKTLRPGVYDKFVQTHKEARKYAHNTPTYLPWHRKFLLEFENQLRSLPGYQCITLPYWDSDTDTYDETMATPLRKNTFGELSQSGSQQLKCVGTGVAAGWEKSNGKCVTRWRRGAEEYGFVDTGSLAALVSSYRKYEDFRPRLEAAPHAAVHNFIGGDMAGLNSSPEDPLFWIHHAQLDRIWTVWQNYWGHHTVGKKDVSAEHYSPEKGKELDSVMPFPYNTNGDTLDCFKDSVTVRDMLRVDDLPGGDSYTYGTDAVAELLGECKDVDWVWMVPGTANPVTCCGDGTTDPGEECDDGNTDDNDKCSNTCALSTSGTRGSRNRSIKGRGKPGGSGARNTFRARNDDLTSAWVKIKKDMQSRPNTKAVLKFARKCCEIRGFKTTASPTWKSESSTKVPDEWFTSCGFLPDTP